MYKITQDMRFNQVVIEYSFKHGVTKAAIRYKTSRQNIYRWRNSPFSGKRFTSSPQPYKQMQYPGQRVQIDVKFVPSTFLVGDVAEEKFYQYTFIDEYSRFRYLEAFKEHSIYSSTQFLLHVIEKFPYAIECVQTDNGFEFTNEMGNSQKKPLTLFEKTPAQLNIRHKKIRAFTPRHNGKVERSHLKDNEYFYADHKFYSFEDFQKQLSVHQHRYNNFPIRPLNRHSPKQVLFTFPNL